jgi:hypothetical protein
MLINAERPALIREAPDVSPLRAEPALLPAVSVTASKRIPALNRQPSGREEPMKVSNFFVGRLHQWGVRRIYGYQGDGINDVLGAQKRANSIEFIHLSSAPAMILVINSETFRLFESAGHFLRKSEIP